MKSLILITTTVLLFAGLSQACIDKSFKQIAEDKVEDVVEILNDSYSADRCLKKLERKDVDLAKMSISRKERAEGDEGPIMHTYKFTGQTKTGDRFLLMMNYSIETHSYSCQKVQINPVMPKGCGG